MMDPKRRGRYVATPEEWVVLMRVVLGLQTGMCACGCRRLVHSFHHLLSKGQGGDDVLSNLAGLYGDGTRGCHGALTSGNPVIDLDGSRIIPAEVRAGIGRRLREDQRAYVVNREGQWYLDKHYS
jgi:hypothetical protein